MAPSTKKPALPDPARVVPPNVETRYRGQSRQYGSGIEQQAGIPEHVFIAVTVVVRQTRHHRQRDDRQYPSHDNGRLEAAGYGRGARAA